MRLLLWVRHAYRLPCVISHKRLGEFDLVDADELDGKSIFHVWGYIGIACEGLFR